MKIVLITTGHSPFDERIFHKFSVSLKKASFDVTIITASEEISQKTDGIIISGFNGKNLNKRDKIFKIKELLKTSDADFIICCEPLPLLAAFAYQKKSQKRVKIFSDITEWYPENVAFKQYGLQKWMTYIKLFLFNIYATNLADELIIGEEMKKKRYNFIAPFRKKTVIGYYPVLKYFNITPVGFDGRNLVLCYAGVMTFERGVLKLLDLAGLVAQKHTELNVVLRLIGKFQYEEESLIFQEKISQALPFQVEMVEWGDYRLISEKIGNADICLDLRTRNFVYRNSLPIKIFEYMACGKPVLFSDIKAIRNEFRTINWGFLVDPENLQQIAEKITLYIKNRELLNLHALTARNLVEEKYNWENEEKKLIKLFVQ